MFLSKSLKSQADHVHCKSFYFFISFCSWLPHYLSLLLWKHRYSLHYKTTNYKHIRGCPCSVTEREGRKGMWGNVQYARNSIQLMENSDSLVEPLSEALHLTMPHLIRLWQLKVYLHCTEVPKKLKDPMLPFTISFLLSYYFLILK